jgi:hypothetical protein
MAELHGVFGIATEVRPLSYVDRGGLDERLQYLHSRVPNLTPNDLTKALERVGRLRRRLVSVRLSSPTAQKRADSFSLTAPCFLSAIRNSGVAVGA